MIKQLLKRIFPVAFLKQCFLLYNRIRMGTVDRLLYHEVRIKKSQFTWYKTEFPFRVNQVSLEDLEGSSVYGYMKEWLVWTQDEFLLQFNKPCWIEPEYGWAMIAPNRLIYESIAFSRTAHQRKPGLMRFWRRNYTRSFPKVISLRDSGEENYFHFFNDVLSKLFFLKQHRVPIEQLPVVVASKLWNKSYFQFILTQSEYLRALNWIVQDDDYIYCKSAVFCKAPTHRKDLWAEIISPFTQLQSQTPFRKIFLTRHKSRLRFIENSEEIEAACRNKGYEIIDTDTLNPEQQIKLFSQVSHLVGIHGAGLTNMVFSPAACRVLELFPPPDLGYLPYHYILLSKMRGFRYRALIGDAPKAPFSGGFLMNADRLIQALSELEEE